jgi:hypothetical protein
LLTYCQTGRIRFERLVNVHRLRRLFSFRDRAEELGVMIDGFRAEEPIDLLSRAGDPK